MASDVEPSPLSPIDRPRSTPPEQHLPLERTDSATSVGSSAGLIISSRGVEPISSNGTLENNTMDFEPPKHGVGFRAGHELLISLLATDKQQQQASKNASSKEEPTAKRQIEITRKTFEDDEMISYLDHLASSHVSQLRVESEALAEQASHIQEELARLAYTDYKTFLDSHAATGSMRSGFAAASDSLDKAIGLLPELESASQEFTKAASSILAERAKTSLVLAHHTTLLDILEIPQLIDTFVRNGYYEEAMDLKNYAQRLVIRYPNISLLSRIAVEVEQCGTMMLNQLVNLLRGDVKLPVCIRVIGYLRRLEAYSEYELRLMFLQQRDLFFRAQLPRPTGEAADYLKRYIDSSREHFFDIITQYRAIFSDGPSAQGLLAGATSTGAVSSLAADPSLGGNTVLSTLSILASYVTTVLDDFIAQLETHLPRVVDIPQLGSLLTQTMYYGMSLGRVGIDFRQCVGKRFERVIGDVVYHQMRSGVDIFIEYVTKNGIEAVQPVKVSTMGSISRASGGEASIYQAPASLIAWPPLGNLVNYFFSSYNALRICAPLSQIRRLASDGIESGLTRASKALSGVGSKLDSTSTHHQPLINNHRQCAKLFAEVVVPAICDGFEKGVFAGSVPSEGVINREACFAAVKELIPKATTAPTVSPIAREPRDSMDPGTARSSVDGIVRESVDGATSRPSVDSTAPIQSVDNTQQPRPSSESSARPSVDSGARASLDSKPPRASTDVAGASSSPSASTEGIGRLSADQGARISLDRKSAASEAAGSPARSDTKFD